MEFTTIKNNLLKLGYEVTEFETAAEATAYLNKAIDGETVGIGGSVTVGQIGLYNMLATHNDVCWHGHLPDGMTDMEVRLKAIQSSVYISSVNGIAETGEIVNIDATGNRVSAISFGHKKVYLIIGENKIAPTFDDALYRARNVAAPLNAKRLKRKTPCAQEGLKCYDCKSPERICRILSVLWNKPTGAKYEVVLIHEKLGY